MKLIRTLALVLLLATAARATTLTGVVTIGPKGLKFTGKACFSLTQGGQTSTNALLAGGEQCFSINNGQFNAGASVVGVDMINPSGVLYKVVFKDMFGGVIDTRYYAVTGTTWNIGTAAPTLANNGTVVYTSGVSKDYVDNSITSALAGVSGLPSGVTSPGVGSLSLTGTLSTAGLVTVGTNATSVPGIYSGTVYGTTQFNAAATGFGNASGYFGSGNYVSMPAAIMDSFGPSSSFTIEARVKTTGTATSFAVGGSTSNTIWFGVDGTTHKMVASVNINGSAGNRVATSGAVINDGNWHHLAFVMQNGTTVYLFVDGVLGTSFGGGTPYVPSASGIMSIGDFRLFPGTFSWNTTGAQIDEVAIWNVAKYTTPFTPPSAPYTGSESGLMALYHLDSNASDTTVVSAPPPTVIDPNAGITDLHIAPRMSFTFANGGSPLTAAKACTVAPSSGSVKSITLMSDGTSGSATVDVGSETFAQFLAGTTPTSMTNSHPVTFTGARGVVQTGFANWTTSTITKGTVYCFTLSSPGSIVGLTGLLDY